MYFQRLKITFIAKPGFHCTFINSSSDLSSTDKLENCQMRHSGKIVNSEYSGQDLPVCINRMFLIMKVENFIFPF